MYVLLRFYLHIRLNETQLSNAQFGSFSDVRIAFAQLSQHFSFQLFCHLAQGNWRLPSYHRQRYHAAISGLASCRVSISIKEQRETLALYGDGGVHCLPIPLTSRPTSSQRSYTLSPEGHRGSITAQCSIRGTHPTRMMSSMI